MTSTTKPQTTSQLLADLETGKAAYPAAAAARQEYLRQKEAEVARDKADPSINSPATIAKIIGELNAAQESAEALDNMQVEYLQRQREERFFRENADALADALEVDLAAATSKLPERRKSFVAWLTELPSKLYQPEVTEAERDALLEERQKREDAEEALQANIRAAKSGIAYFRKNPLPANFGGPRGIIGAINLG